LSRNSLKLSAATDLLHNRIMAQIMHEYHALGFEITLPTRRKGEKIHDFDIAGYGFEYKCEVKTIQSFGDIERFGQTEPIRTGGYRLTKRSHKSLIASIKDDFEDAKKVGESGITIVAPWSYKINALLREYFKDGLLPYPIIPSPNTTILVLTSDHVFQDCYISFPTDLASYILEGALENIQSVGISPLKLMPIRQGLTQRVTLTRKDVTPASLSVYNISLGQE
jgi:hypothetical protein